MQKTKAQKREDLYNKKRSRKTLNKQLMSLDFGFLGPPDSESSEDDLYTGGGSVVTGQSGHRVDQTKQSQFKYKQMPSPLKRQLYQVDLGHPSKVLDASLILFAFPITFRYLQSVRL